MANHNGRKNGLVQETKGACEETRIEPPRSLWRTAEPYLMLALLSAVAGIVFREYLLFTKAYLFKDIGSDSINIFYPAIVHVVDYLRTEGIPKWSFNQGMGQNLFPGIGDVFLPIFYLVGRENIGFAIAYVEVLKILIGGFFFYLYLKRLDLTPSASLIGGVLFGFSGYVLLGGGWYMFSYDAMCGAIVLFGFESLFKKNIWWILPIPFALLAAYQPFNLYLYGFLLFVYGTARFLEDRHWNLRVYAGFIVKISGLAFLGAAISSVLLLEGIAQLLYSPRVGGDVSYVESLTSQSLFARGSRLEISSVVLRLFSSDLQGSGDFFRGWANYLESPLLYCGLITLLAAPQFLLSLDKPKRNAYAALVTACMIALVFPFWRYAFWGFTGNYYRTFSFFIALLILYLGVRGLSNIDRTSNVKPVALALSLAVLLGLLYVPPYEKFTDVDSALRGVITFFLFVYAVLIGLRGTQKYKRFAQALTLVAVCTEAAYFSSITANKRVVVSAEELSQRVGYNDYTVDAIRHIRSMDSGFFRVNKYYTSGPARHPSLNDAKVQQYYGTSSYNGFNQMYYIKFLEGVGVLHTGNETQTRWAVGLTWRPLLQILASVKYVLTKNATEYSGSMWTPVSTFGDVRVLRNEFFVPLGVGYDTFILKSDFAKLDTASKDQVLTKAFVIDDSEQNKYKRLTRFDPASVLRKYTHAELGQSIGRLQASAMQMSEHHQSLIRGTIDLKAVKLLFFSIPYDKGWAATVDGKPAEIQLIDFGLMGLLLESGEHTIELKFRPRFFTAGAIASTASLLGYILLIFVPACLRRRCERGSVA